MAAMFVAAASPPARESVAPFSPETLAGIARVEAEIARIEANTLKRLTSVPDNQVQQIELGRRRIS
jgi:hypothetical protein